MSGVAHYFGCSTGAVYGWLNSGVLVGCQPQVAHYSDERPRKGRRGVWRIYDRDLQAFLAKLRSGRVAMPTRGRKPRL